MSYSGDAAEQVVRMSLEGTEVAVKLAGAGAKQLAVLLYAVLKDQKKTKGKIRLSNMLRSGKELKVFAVQDKELSKFCREAKKYGVLYTVIKDKKQKDGFTDIFVRAEDAGKVNRIFERFKLATVDMGSVKTDIEKEKAERGTEKGTIERPMIETPGKARGDAEGIVSEKGDPAVSVAENGGPAVSTPVKDDVDEFLDALFGTDDAKESAQGNPTRDRTQESRQSGPSSGKKQTSERDAGERTGGRRSVKKEMDDIRREQRQKSTGEIPEFGRSKQHIQPNRKPSRKRRKQHERI